VFGISFIFLGPNKFSDLYFIYLFFTFEQQKINHKILVEQNCKHFNLVWDNMRKNWAIVINGIKCLKRGIFMIDVFNLFQWKYKFSAQKSYIHIYLAIRHIYTI